MISQNNGTNGREMPKLKIDAFFEEFPWLGHYVPRQGVQKVFVSRMEQEILTLRAKRGLFYPMPDEKLLLLDKDGKSIATVAVEIGRWRRFWDQLYELPPDHGPTIEEALMTLKEGANDVSMILSYFNGNVIIYKAPKGFSVGGWVRQQSDMERQALKAQSAAIDAEAECVRK